MHPPPGVWEPWFLSDFPVGEGRRGAGSEPQKNPPSHHGRWGELELTVVAADRSRAMSSPSAKQDLSRKASAGGSFSQALSSALNYPHREAEESIASLLYHGDYNVLWESPQRLLGLPQDQTWVEPQIAPLVGRASVTLEDFREYMASMSELVSRFESMHPMGAAESMAGGEEERARGAAHAWNSQHALAKEELKKVPSFYFEKRFHLEDNDTFQRTGAAGDADECAALQDELSNYLDVVEQNLMREIQARSSAFYSALNTLQDLYAEVDKTMETIVEFRWEERMEEKVGREVSRRQAERGGGRAWGSGGSWVVVPVKRFLVAAEISSSSLVDSLSLPGEPCRRSTSGSSGMRSESPSCEGTGRMLRNFTASSPSLPT
eukprot:765050-Hanusia_phi.AAC.1